MSGANTAVRVIFRVWRAWIAAERDARGRAVAKPLALFAPVRGALCGELTKADLVRRKPSTDRGRNSILVRHQVPGPQQQASAGGAPYLFESTHCACESSTATRSRREVEGASRAILCSSASPSKTVSGTPASAAYRTCDGCFTGLA